MYVVKYVFHNNTGFSVQFVTVKKKLYKLTAKNKNRGVLTKQIYSVKEVFYTIAIDSRSAQ